MKSNKTKLVNVRNLLNQFPDMTIEDGNELIEHVKKMILE